MKLSRLAPKSPFLLAPLLLGGCAELEQHLVISETGSATMEVNLTLPGKTLRELEKMRDDPMRPGEGDGTSPLDFFDEAKIKAMAAEEGVHLTSYRARAEGDGKKVEMKVAFKDLEELKRSDLGGPDAELLFMKGEQEGTIRMLLYPNGRENYEMALKDIKELEALDPRDLEFLEQNSQRMRQELEGLKMTYRFTLPGKVLSVGEHLTIEEDGKTARFSFSDKDIKSFKDTLRLQAMFFEVVFDGEGVKLPLQDKAEPVRERKEEKDEKEEKDQAEEPAQEEGTMSRPATR